jgi:geranylgeranylglycerol-phosphate geranylgeranyltransferase
VNGGGWKIKLQAYLELIRYPLFPIPIVSTLPGALIAGGDAISWRFWTALLTAALGYFAGMMKNDYFHRDLDAKAHPTRPIPSGRLSVKEVFIAASSLYLICAALGFLMNWKAGAMVMLLVMISHLYNAIFKEKGVLGSISLPLGIALLSVFGALAVSGGIPGLVWYAFGSIFLFDFGTHIVTTFKDIERDRRLGVVTTPIQIGIRPALMLSGCATLGAFALAITPLIMGTIGWNYAVWLALAFAVTAFTRVPLMIRPSERNGYLALKGAMTGSISFFPALAATTMPMWGAAAIILPLMMISWLLLRRSRQEV